MLIHSRKPLGMFDRRPGLAPGRGRWDRQTCGKILPARSYRMVQKVKACITPEISF
jgi:hypothetical protein